ncbi:MAG: nucleotidyltransferase substrate binding protein [Desulfuromusa sp.]|nr:nucleotidyltransferase substrate binding protein [Desulfuromusa sp.]
MALQLDSLQMSVEALERSLHASTEESEGLSDALCETLRAGVIQNFEVAYELSWKFIQRWIRTNKTPEDADHPRTRKELFRMAARYGLIADPLPWFEYGDARNLTSHTYDAKRAAAVYTVASRFARDARDLLHRLEERND